jgi:hypothetical protein
VNQLVLRFADYYFNALAEYDQGMPTIPPVWKLTFDLARGAATTVMEDLLLGINAHINHDLPLAISDTLLPDWSTLSGTQRERRAVDHRTINQIIAETTVPVQKQMLEPHARLAGAAAKVLGPVLGWELDRIITGWRSDVWTYAVRITETTDAAERESLRLSLEQISLARIHLLLSARQVRNKAFGYPISWLHARRLV